MKTTARNLGALAILLAALVAILHPRGVYAQALPCNAVCVTTHAYDNNQDNVNSTEVVFRATNFHQPTTIDSIINLHGIVYAQPLYVPSLITNPIKDGLFVATEENWVYALDAANLSGIKLWTTNLNNSGESAVPDGKLSGGNTCTNISPEVGITGTPVIDIGANSAHPNVLYAISAHYNTSTHLITQRLNALSIKTGQPVATPLIIPTALGSTFMAGYQNQRAALALTYDGNNNPLIYVAWGSYCDHTPYAGWAAVFTLTGTSTLALSLVGAYNTMGTDANAKQSGIWMGGAGPAIDDGASGTGQVYLSTGNGTVSYNPTALTDSALGMSILQLKASVPSSTLTATGAYTVAEWCTLNYGGHGGGPTCPYNSNQCAYTLTLPPPYSQGPPVSYLCTMTDMDIDAGGVVLARANGVVLPKGDNFVVLAAGKEGVFYDIDPMTMSSNTAPDPNAPCSQGSAIAIQCFGAIQLPSTEINVMTPAMDDTGSRCSAAFWASNLNGNYLLVGGSKDTDIWGYKMNSSGGMFNPAYQGAHSFGSAVGFPGSCPVVSWSSAGADDDAVLWILQTAGYKRALAPALYAFQALPSGGLFGPPLFTDTTSGPGAVQFSEPTVTNGYVFVAGQVQGVVCAGPPCSGEVVSWH
jgi:hypothetical protein